MMRLKFSSVLILAMLISMLNTISANGNQSSERLSSNQSKNDLHNPQTPSQQKPDRSTKGEQYPSQQQHPTSDLSPPNQLTPRQDLNKKATDDRNHSSEDSSEFTVLHGRKLKITDVIMAILTFCLVIIAGFQGWQLLRQVMANETAAVAAKYATDLARKEFLSTHRPKLRVRRIVPTKDKISFQYDVVNIGNRAAHVTFGNVDVTLWPLGSLPPLPDQFFGPFNIGASVIEAGAMIRTHFTVDDADKVETINFEYAVSIPEHQALHFIGFLKYADDLGNIRETSFCRRYDGTKFIAVDNLDYEFED